jgi:hypothetical protein
MRWDNYLMQAGTQVEQAPGHSRNINMATRQMLLPPPALHLQLPDFYKQAAYWGYGALPKTA